MIVLMELCVSVCSCGYFWDVDWVFFGLNWDDFFEKLRIFKKNFKQVLKTFWKIFLKCFKNLLKFLV